MKYFVVTFQPLSVKFSPKKHNVTEILLKVVLNTITLTPKKALDQVKPNLVECSLIVLLQCFMLSTRKKLF